MESLKEWLEEAKTQGIRVAALAERKQAAESGLELEAVRAVMGERLDIMRRSAEKGMDPHTHSLSGLTGGGASRLEKARLAGRTCAGGLCARAESIALAVAESNAAMGRIVAAPTAGACGILPGVFLALEEEKSLDREALTDGLFMAAAVGDVISRRASVSGARGGCQAECGTAAAMAAAGAVILMGGSDDQAFDAAAFALMNILGLVCDPVGGLVEVPCVYRNVSGALGAIAAADLALSGIPSPLPPDEVIDAMKAVGDLMPASLRETGEGGCAACPSALRYRMNPDHHS